MKKAILFCFVLLCSFAGFSQAVEGAVEYQKKQQPAAVIELPYPTSVVNAAMKDFLSKKGKSKGNDIKGFTTYRNTQPLLTDSANADLYFKTERKSKNEKEITVVSLLLSPVDIFSNTGNLHYLTMDDARTYLNELALTIGSYDVERSIKEQNDAVIKGESKYNSLLVASADLEKKRTELDKKIIDNKAEIQAQLKEVENQKQNLAQRVGQRKL